MSFEIPFSHIAEIIMGQSPKGEEVNNEGIGLPLLNGPTEFTDRYPAPVQHTAYAKKISLPGDILFCVRGSTTGRMNYSDQKYCIGRGLAAIRGRNGYPTPYVKAVLETYLPKLLAAATGSTFPNVSKDLINNIPVSVLPVENACNISKLIELQEEKVFTNNQINQTLEQMAQALFKSWFVNFEPVKAKMAVLEAGGSQEDAMLAAMTAISGKDDDALVVFEREHPEQYAELKATAELFPSAMQDSELGNIPVTWELGKLQDLLVLQRGFDLPSSARKDGEFPLIAASGPNGTHNVAIAKAPGVITGRSGVLGKVYLTLEDYWPLNTTLWVKEFKRATPCYAYELLRLLDMKAFNAGSAVPSLNRNHIHSLSYPLPPMALVNLFESSALLLHQRAHVNLKHSQSLALLRDTFLPKLLSGEITLPEAEQAVSEAENV
ncbi:MULTISPECIES: restriction endonuclease subunit S [Enterobacter]|uniref:restriction endonuclease subunit S n=1 Tax=Enterobacter hormaechei TaxID=158836 RepID=UPI000EF99DC4|nr:restriction endonuclease subunit S [Enterobacter hormaechei]RMA00842.1 restriction endonuclease subunit S [Enterobacter hormaechei subsp. hoffmannii]